MLTFDKKHYDPASAEYNENHARQRDEWKTKLKIHAINEKQIVDRFGEAMSSSVSEDDQNTVLAANQFASLVGNDGKPALDFWRRTETTVKEVADNDQGAEFVGDLMGIATPLDIGVTSNAYAIETDLSSEVVRSMDFKTPVGLDHNEQQYDSDPIPTFTAGYGVSFRKARGGLRVGIDLAASSLRLKTKWMVSNIADYMLDGDAKIKVDGKVGQGIRNHRNAKQINLGSGSINGLAGANINLTTATNDEIIAFFNQYFAARLDDAFINKIDVLWVSPEIMRVLDRPFSASANFKEGKLIDYVLMFGRIGAVKRTFKLSGNEFFGYIRNRDYITPLVGAPMASVPVPRVMPYDNYNFMLYAAVGLQIKADVNGKGNGVVYAKNFA